MNKVFLDKKRTYYFFGAHPEYMTLVSKNSISHFNLWPIIDDEIEIEFNDNRITTDGYISISDKSLLTQEQLENIENCVDDENSGINSLVEIKNATKIEFNVHIEVEAKEFLTHIEQTTPEVFILPLKVNNTDDLLYDLDHLTEHPEFKRFQKYVGDYIEINDIFGDYFYNVVITTDGEIVRCISDITFE